MQSRMNLISIAARVACAIAIAVAAVMGVAAQNRGQAPPAGQPPAAGQPARGGAPASNARRFVVMGCVSRDGAPADQRFLITDPRGDKPTLYKLDGDKNELSFHVGHTIEVSGPLTAPAASATGPNAAALTITAESITYVSSTCAKK
jgi:hypothetical protein